MTQLKLKGLKKEEVGFDITKSDKEFEREGWQLTPTGMQNAA